MKNVLIPTDFTIASLAPVRPLAECMDEKVNILMFHAFGMPGSLMDSMMTMKGGGHGRFITEELRLECRRLSNRHTQVRNISFRIMHGTTVTAFQNFADANAIDFILLPDNYFFRPVTGESVDPLPMFRKSGIDIVSNLSSARGRLTPAQRPQQFVN